MAAINNDWLDALKGEFKKPYYKKLFETVNEEYRTRQIFPPADDIFNAFHLTPLHNVKAVILGQDPYHNVGQAHGLCFSVKKGVDIPPSLVNIYKELHDDLGCTIPNHGCLTKWAEQGVLMLNTVLTVRAHQANSHKDIGWEEFTDAAIMALNSQDRPIVFILWGTAEMGDLVRGALISIPKSQYESAEALGLSRRQMYRFIIIPQSLRRLLPPAINLFTRIIKTTSLVVLIGVVEMLKTGQQIIEANRYTAPDAALWIYAAIFFLYFLACYPLSRMAAYLEKKWTD